MKCAICNSDFYHMSYDPPDPGEPCWCGQQATGRLREWNGWRAVFDWGRYRLASKLCDWMSASVEWLTHGLDEKHRD